MNAWMDLEEAAMVAREARLALASMQAMFQARERARGVNQAGTAMAVELNVSEAYGYGVILGLLVDQLQRLEQDLSKTLQDLVAKAG